MNLTSLILTPLAGLGLISVLSLPSHAAEKAAVPAPSASQSASASKKPGSEAVDTLHRTLTLHALSNQLTEELEGTCAPVWNETQVKQASTANLLFMHKALTVCPALPLMSSVLLEARAQHQMPTITFGDFALGFCKESQSSSAFAPFYSEYQAMASKIRDQELKAQLAGKSCEVRQDLLVAGVAKQTDSSFREVLRALHLSQVLK